MAVLASGTSYQFFQILMRGSCIESNGLTKTFSNLFDYLGPPANVVTSSNANTVKTALATAFTSTCWTSVLSTALNGQYTPLPLQVRALDVPTDAFLACNTPGITASTTAARQSSHNCVVMRKNTGVRGRSWSSGKWYFSPLNASEENSPIGDEETMTNWIACKSPLAANLSVTINSVVYAFAPILISATGSQMISSPTTIYYTPITSCSVDKRISSLRRRNQKLLPGEPPTA